MASLPASVARVVLSLIPVAAVVAQQATAPGFVNAAKAILPSLVTVRTFVRIDAATDVVAAVPATATVADRASGPQAAGWLVETAGERDYPGFRPFGSASGFFVTADGEVLTTLAPLRVTAERNVDVVEIETHDNHRILADIVGVEPTLQLAVLRCAVFPSWATPGVHAATFGDSDAVEIGDHVLAVGDPAGPERFLAAGLLGAKPSRDCYQELMSATYMQASMTVPAGALGGPLVGLDGKVLGILSPVDGSSPGSAWALPAKIVVGLHDAIRTAGTDRSPWLGFSVMSRAEIAAARGFATFQKMPKPPHGILLENVFAPSPAVTAGLQPDDFLTHFEGVEIHAPVDFQRQLYLAGVGRTVAVKFFRSGQTFERSITIEARPPEAKPR